MSNWWSERRRILFVCSPRAWATTLKSDLVNKLENVVIYAKSQKGQGCQQFVKKDKKEIMKTKLEQWFLAYL